MKILMPYPPSANSYLRHTARGTYRTSTANTYRASVATRARISGARMIEGAAVLIATLHPKLTAAGKASKTCIDLDNCVKVLCDALEGVCYANDKQLRHISLTIGDPISGGGISIEISQA